MKVYKFGGASIANPEAMRALLPIILQAQQPLVVVVSAYGKTTNALEKIVNAAVTGDITTALSLTEDLEEAHNAYAKAVLTPDNYKAIQPRLQEYYTEIHWTVDDADRQSRDYIYDQIVCIGEILSTTIFAAFLQQEGANNQWLDARDLIRTNAIYRDPEVDIEYSTKQVQSKMKPHLLEKGIVVTQGFIGSTDENTSTTLGREGSDYSAALFAYMLDAESVSIWKDVEGLFNTDPRLFPNAVKIDEITYYEVIEMAYYGASVIHPKTIKPLENKKIPLYVKCFLKPELKGTCIKAETDAFIYPPIIVLKKNQILLQFTSKDFSFITEDNISKIYKAFAKQHLKMNLMQNSAISFVACVDNDSIKIERLIADLEVYYKILKNEDVQLLTLRHGTQSTMEEITKGRVTMLEQKTRNTVRVVLK